MIHRSRGLFSAMSVDDILPKIKPALTYDSALRRFRQQLLQLNASETLVEDVVSRAMTSGITSAVELAAFALAEGLTVPQENAFVLGVVRSTVHENLFSRGYSREETAYWAPSYLSGELCLVRKRSMFFELLQDLVDHAVSIVQVDSSYADVLLKAIYRCRSMFFQSKGGDYHESSHDGI